MLLFLQNQKFLDLLTSNSSTWRFWFWKVFTHLYYVLFINPTVKRTITTFQFDMGSSPFRLITFSTINSVWFVFCYCFSSDVLTISSSLRSLITYVFDFFNHKNSLIFFNHKNSFRPIWCVTFWKNMFIFWNSNNITNFKFRIYLIDFWLELIYVFDFISTGFILIVLWYVM